MVNSKDQEREYAEEVAKSTPAAVYIAAMLALRVYQLDYDQFKLSEITTPERRPQYAPDLWEKVDIGSTPRRQ